MMMLSILSAAAFDLLLVVGSVWALWSGGRTERIGVAIFVPGATIPTLARVWLGNRWVTLDPATVIIDVAVTVAFFVLAVRTDRFWPIWGFGLMLADLAIHGARARMGGVTPWTYATSEQALGFLILAVLFAGTWEAVCRRRQGPDA